MKNPSEMDCEYASKIIHFHLFEMFMSEFIRNDGQFSIQSITRFINHFAFQWIKWISLKKRVEIVHALFSSDTLRER